MLFFSSCCLLNFLGNTEEKIMEAINNLKGSITILIISHRLSTVEKCDRVIKIEKGKYFE